MSAAWHKILLKKIIAYLLKNFHIKSKKTFAFFNLIYVWSITIEYEKTGKEAVMI